jgi:hypothetical protein
MDLFYVISACFEPFACGQVYTKNTSAALKVHSWHTHPRCPPGCTLLIGCPGQRATVMHLLGCLADSGTTRKPAALNPTFHSAIRPDKLEFLEWGSSSCSWGCIAINHSGCVPAPQHSWHSKSARSQQIQLLQTPTVAILSTSHMHVPPPPQQGVALLPRRKLPGSSPNNEYFTYFKVPSRGEAPILLLLILCHRHYRLRCPAVLYFKSSTPH